MFGSISKCSHGDDVISHVPADDHQWRIQHPQTNSSGANVTSRVRCEEWPTLVLGCIWGLFVKYQNSPEKIKRHITNTDKIQQNAQSFYIAHTLIYSFIHSLVHSFIPITHHTTHASPMHHPFITHCIILCITHSSHWAPMLQVGFGVKNDQHLSWGVYGVYSSNIKIALKR